MCKIPTISGEHQGAGPKISSSITASGERTAFAARRLTRSTFLIVEDDEYREEPFIYVKLVPAARTIVILDTGCGGKPRDPDAKVTSLRDFVERVPVEDNDNRPLNPGGKMEYIVVLSHCHFDHIRTSRYLEKGPVGCS